MGAGGGGIFFFSFFSFLFSTELIENGFECVVSLNFLFFYFFNYFIKKCNLFMFMLVVLL